MTSFGTGITQILENVFIAICGKLFSVNKDGFVTKIAPQIQSSV